MMGYLHDLDLKELDAWLQDLNKKFFDGDFLATVTAKEYDIVFTLGLDDLIAVQRYSRFALADGHDRDLEDMMRRRIFPALCKAFCGTVYKYRQTDLLLFDLREALGKWFLANERYDYNLQSRFTGDPRDCFYFRLSFFGHHSETWIRRFDYICEVMPVEDPRQYVTYNDTLNRAYQHFQYRLDKYVERVGNELREKMWGKP